MSFLKNYKIITITHHNLNVDELGHFVIKHQDKIELEDRLLALKQAVEVQEIVYLSTCNRISFICYSDIDFDGDFLELFFKNVNPQLSEDRLKRIHKFTDIYNGTDAIEHLFEVASSMDSLVVGEREIYRQFREAYNFCSSIGLTGDNLRLLEKYTVNAAKSIYANTKIGEKPLSIVSLAIQAMMRNELSDDSRILIVGAGETNTLVGKFLKKYSFENISIFNRSLDNASELSQMLDAEAYHLTELEKFDKGFDVMIVCTGSTDPIINTHNYKQLLQKENNQKIVIDLSVPANVSEEVVSSFDVNYIDIEKLRIEANKNLEFRKKEVHHARKIIKTKLSEFHQVYQQRQLEKALKFVPQEIKKVKENALENIYKKKLESLDQETLGLINEMMDYMEKKCVSVPIKAAKSLALK